MLIDEAHSSQSGEAAKDLRAVLSKGKAKKDDETDEALAAAEAEVDATPMEGFDPKALDEILGLKEKGLRSVVMLPLGYRKADEDWLLNLKKVRRPTEQFISWIK